MATITIHKAKTQLSQLVARAEAGEEIVLARGKEQIVRLIPLKPVGKKRVFGAMAGEFEPVPDAFFFDPLPEDELKLWTGEGDDPEDPAR